MTTDLVGHHLGEQKKEMPCARSDQPQLRDSTADHRGEEKAVTRQCKSCPWRIDCEPLSDIPNGYSVDLHEGLRGTIAQPGAVDLCGLKRMMACHYSPVGREFPCAGWLHHQIGRGNNIWLRIEIMRGRIPTPVIDGDQHQCFDDTLPKVAP